jgi:hypothetical protein
MSGSHDPRAAMQVQAFVALCGQNRLAGVEPHPHAHRRARRPGMLGQRFLRLRRCRDRPPRQREDRMESVALRAQLDSAVGVDRAAQEGPMDAEHRGPPIAQSARERGRALDVAEQQGDRPGRKIARRSHPPTIAFARRAAKGPAPGCSMGAPTPTAPHSHSGLRSRNRLNGAAAPSAGGSAPVHATRAPLQSSRAPAAHSSFHVAARRRMPAPDDGGVSGDLRQTPVWTTITSLGREF